MEWKLGQGYTVRLSEMAAMPLHAATSEVSNTSVGARSKVTWTFDYRVKYGPLGWLMGQTLMKMMMGKIIDGNLKGLAEKVHRRAADKARHKQVVGRVIEIHRTTDWFDTAIAQHNNLVGQGHRFNLKRFVFDVN